MRYFLALPLSAREAVETLTPADSATSRKVTGPDNFESFFSEGRIEPGGDRTTGGVVGAATRFCSFRQSIGTCSLNLFSEIALAMPQVIFGPWTGRRRVVRRTSFCFDLR